MAVDVSLQKREESPLHCVYEYGAADSVMGRLSLEKQSGDIEIEHLSEADEGPNERYVLVQVVARLQGYHDEDVYPEAEKWEA